LLTTLALLGAAAWLSGCGNSLINELPPAEGAGVSAALNPGPATSATPVHLPREGEVFTSAATPGNVAYRIGHQDVLDIAVFMVPDLSKTVQVTESGTINLPLIGDVVAAGKSAQELERELEKKYGVKYLKSPQITVSVKEYNSQRVTIEGAVKKPGVYPIRGQGKLMELIAMAEGLQPSSDSTVIVVRQMGGKRYAAKFAVDDIRAGRTPDAVIRPGDVIVANSSQFKETWQNFLKVLPSVGTFALLL
jgi:polysaccharide export outer membrane protein